MCRTARILCLVLLLAPAHFQDATGAPTEDELLRQMKTDVFEERWSAVLTDCESFIKTYPTSESLPRTYYYRAKALQHLEGREEDALAAYGEFIDRFPNESTLREDATISRMSLAKTLWLRGKKDAINILTKGLEEKGYPRIYAAVQISHLDNRPARARAVPLLQECSRAEKNAEVRNECTLAILRIDPSSVPTQSTESKPPDSRLPAAEPRLIRLEVRSKATGKVTVAVNLPVAFAEALLGSLSEIEQGGEVLEELKRRHIDVTNLWKSLKSLGRETLVEVETEEATIRIWLE